VQAPKVCFYHDYFFLVCVCRTYVYSSAEQR
jgi:hypothetical protein